MRRSQPKSCGWAILYMHGSSRMLQCGADAAARLPNAWSFQVSALQKHAPSLHTCSDAHFTDDLLARATGAIRQGCVWAGEHYCLAAVLVVAADHDGLLASSSQVRQQVACSKLYDAEGGRYKESKGHGPHRCRHSCTKAKGQQRPCSQGEQPACHPSDSGSHRRRAAQPVQRLAACGQRAKVSDHPQPLAISRHGQHGHCRCR